MVSLISKSPLAGIEPILVGDLRLEEAPLERLTSVSPFAGSEAKVAAALSKMGLGWPEPNQVLSKGNTACVWSGRGQAFLINADPGSLDGLAAMTDQTDGWAAIGLSGPGASDVLARLVSVDLRPAAFPPGRVARTPVNHMMAVVERTGADTFRVMVFRSMAMTAVHEIVTAMEAVAARSHL